MVEFGKKLIQTLFVLTALLLTAFTNGLPSRYQTLDARCEAISIPMCKGLPYNMTHFPNLMGHETQKEATVEIQQFSPLVAANCSPELRQFLCSLYAPVCVPMTGKLHLLKPCRHNCKRVRKGCIGLLKQYGFKWPKSFKCSKFPKKKEEKLCVDWSSKALKKSNKKKKNRKIKRDKKKNRKVPDLGKKTGGPDEASKPRVQLKSRKGSRRGKKGNRREKKKKRRRNKKKKKARKQRRNKRKKVAGVAESKSG